MTAHNLFDLTGKVALVTGGNGGLGLGIALGLAGAGANIVIAARNVEKTAQALEDVRWHLTQTWVKCHRSRWRSRCGCSEKRCYPNSGTADRDGA